MPWREVGNEKQFSFTTPGFFLFKHFLSRAFLLTFNPNSEKITDGPSNTLPENLLASLPALWCFPLPSPAGISIADSPTPDNTGSVASPFQWHVLRVGLHSQLPWCLLGSHWHFSQEAFRPPSGFGSQHQCFKHVGTT